MDKYIFWTNDPTILIRDGNYTKFIPQKNDTRVQQLNAITLLCIYFIIISYFTGNLTELVIQIPLIIIFLLVIFYYIYETDNLGKLKELKKNKNIEGMDNTDNINNNDNIKLEAGYYDSEGNLQTGSFLSHKKLNNKGLAYDFEDMLKYRKTKCRVPTPDNPFMNPSINDYNNGEVPAPCNDDDENISDMIPKISEAFNKDLYRDLSDLFDVQNSQRQFYTLPQGYPNDQQAFAEWCYKTKSICKDGGDCVRYEDLRYKNNYI
jgi:hypothetical protein